VDLLDAQGQKYAAHKGQIYDLTAQQKAYQNVVGLGEQLKTAESGLKDAFKRGDGGDVAKEQKAIADLVAQIKAALPAAEAFAKAMGDQKMVETLDQVKQKLDGVKASLVDADQINEMLASGLTDAFGKSMDAIGKAVQGIGSWGNAIRGVANAFRQFAADFLKQIAEMIIKQQLMNLLSKTPIGGFISGGVNAASGVAAAAPIATAMTSAGVTVGTTIATEFTTAGMTVAAMIASALAAGGAADGGADALMAGSGFALMHGGGIVGAPGGMTRSVSPAAFIAAMKYHDGGIPGLSADEVPTILQRGEEVLTASDARHSLNQRSGTASPPPAPMSVKIINARDEGHALSEAMKTDVGEKAILNHVRNNRGAWRAALGPGISSKS
jgi:hypothetical protein